MVIRLLDWLRSPLKRPPDVPQDCRWGVFITYYDTDVYESAVFTAATMLEKNPYKPYLVHHYFWFRHRGVKYRMIFNSKGLVTNLFKTGSRYPAWLNAEAPTKVYFLGQVSTCQVWVEDDSDDDDDEEDAL
ncbi:MAG: hypothetical protein AAGP08_18650 [Pseudomonadota bacterium]